MSRRPGSLAVSRPVAAALRYVYCLALACGVTACGEDDPAGPADAAPDGGTACPASTCASIPKPPLSCGEGRVAEFTCAWLPTRMCGWTQARCVPSDGGTGDAPDAGAPDGSGDAGPGDAPDDAPPIEAGAEVGAAAEAGAD